MSTREPLIKIAFVVVIGLFFLVPKVMEWLEEARAREMQQAFLADTRRQAETAARNEDYAAAFKAWNTLADYGDFDAAYRVGLLYRDGLGVKQSYVKAATWYGKAALVKHPAALTQLAVAYDTGQGVYQDLTEAARLYEEAALFGAEEPLFRLGEIYAQGVGVAPDPKKALRFWQRAAMAGDARGYYESAKMYRDIDHETHSPLRAFVWFDTAASLGHEQAAAARDKIAGTMTAEELAEAREEAVNCREKSFSGC